MNATMKFRPADLPDTTQRGGPNGRRRVGFTAIEVAKLSNLRAKWALRRGAKRAGSAPQHSKAEQAEFGPRPTRRC